MHIESIILPYPILFDEIGGFYSKTYLNSCK